MRNDDVDDPTVELAMAPSTERWPTAKHDLFSAAPLASIDDPTLPLLCDSEM